MGVDDVLGAGVGTVEHGADLSGQGEIGGHDPHARSIAGTSAIAAEGGLNPTGLSNSTASLGADDGRNKDHLMMTAGKCQRVAQTLGRSPLSQLIETP